MPLMDGTSVVIRLSNEREASVVRSLLESYGIPVSVSSNPFPQAVYPMTVGEISLSVPEEFHDEAVGIIEAHRAAGDTADP